MEKIKALAKQYLWLIIIAGLLAVGASVFWGYGKYLENKTDGEIHETHAEANTAVNAAVTSEQTAANASSQRQTEDAVRQRTIAPRLDEARLHSQTSQAQLERARQQFNEKSLPSNSSRASDCVRLARLYPDTKFEYCQQR
jgi:hypothetical protein